MTFRYPAATTGDLVMLRPILILCASLAGISTAAAAIPANPAPSVCHADKIENATGQFIRMTSGQFFQVYPGKGRMDSSVWFPLDRLMLCRLGGNAFQITDLSHKNEQIKALWLQ